jgi:hypothetical protein
MFAAPSMEYTPGAINVMENKEQSNDVGAAGIIGGGIFSDE